MVRDDPTRAARSCPACGGLLTSSMLSQSFCLVDGHPLCAGYDVVECDGCGMVYASPLPSQAALDGYYEQFSKYSDALSGTGGGAQAWDEERLSETASFLSSRIADRDAHILDIGCAAGGLLDQLARRGHSRLSGIDPSRECVNSVRRAPYADTGRISAVQGSVFEIPESIAKADVAILSHVLEHVRDVGEALQRVRMKLVEGGMLYVEVPNAIEYPSFLAAPYLEFNTEHINHFSTHHLTIALTAAGFSILEAGEKLSRSSESTWYPCSWALARAESKEPALGSTPVSASRALSGAIREYIQQSQVMMDAVIARLPLEELRSGELIVWGTGQTAAILLSRSPFDSLRITCFTDSNPRFAGASIRGVPVVRTDQLPATSDTPILVASFLYAKSIERSIRSLGLSNPIVLLGRDS